MTLKIQHGQLCSQKTADYCQSVYYDLEGLRNRANWRRKTLHYLWKWTQIENELFACWVYFRILSSTGSF